jgi:hypothetical protein
MIYYKRKEALVLIDAYKDFFENMISLSLNFAFNWKAGHDNETMSFIISRRSNLGELLQIKDDMPVEWNEFLVQAEEECSEASSAACFEEKMTLRIMPFALSRFEQYCTFRAGLLKNNAGSLRYDAPLKELPANHCNFHISNAVAPKSIFADTEYLPHCFIELMDKSEKEYGYDTLRTFTWLNSHPKWLVLFPQEWYDNMKESDTQVWGNLGYWGQLVTASGSINIKMEEYVRINGTIKYSPRASHCSFAAMREHLNEFLTRQKAC